MSSAKKVVISVFGNELDEQDNTALLLLPKLKKLYPRISFEVQDPTESLEPSGDPWLILDTAIGIDHVTVVEDLNDLEFVKGSSVHDFDVYMELRLRAKIEKLPALKIILVPQGDSVDHAVSHVSEILDSIG
jgi:hypothetical protein